MSKPSVFENRAFKAPPMIGGFNLANEVTPFKSIFDTKPLDDDEALKLANLLQDGSGPDVIANDQISKDIDHLKQITAEIKAIGKQGTLLLGERVNRAREILKPYKDGTFTRWLESAFGTRKTGYNVLSYYELYNALPRDDLRDRFKKLQQRTAYMLASREGDIDTKAEIISEYHQKTHDELVVLIQEKLPVALSDKRTGKVVIGRLLANLRTGIEKLQENSNRLTADDRAKIGDLRTQLSLLV